MVAGQVTERGSGIGNGEDRESDLRVIRPRRDHRPRRSTALGEVDEFRSVEAVAAKGHEEGARLKIACIGRYRREVTGRFARRQAQDLTYFRGREPGSHQPGSPIVRARTIAASSKGMR